MCPRRIAILFEGAARSPAADTVAPCIVPDINHENSTIAGRQPSAHAHFSWVLRPSGHSCYPQSMYASSAAAPSCAADAHAVRRRPWARGRSDAGQQLARLAHRPCACSGSLARMPCSFGALHPHLSSFSFAAPHLSDYPWLGALLPVPDAWRLTRAHLSPASVCSPSPSPLSRAVLVQAGKRHANPWGRSNPGQL